MRVDPITTVAAPVLQTTGEEQQQAGTIKGPFRARVYSKRRGSSGSVPTKVGGETVTCCVAACFQLSLVTNSSFKF